jgi:hypothetical protein
MQATIGGDVARMFVFRTDGYGTSRLFDSKFWDTLETQAGGPVAVALPTLDWLLAARPDDPSIPNSPPATDRRHYYLPRVLRTGSR